ncbi:GntR family transcriptional regulator [Rhodococcoides kyotonense]|uniref:DNA-binding transcriptional regulator, GntR family n=1 Tax=Rhodococcoides kyotonense TaxID=398843 RepID=A0A239N0F2_9NOCA|nr:GntR family transcriptional regulator [Rhodococcus kyotonensis]SNT47904.1 DNA-binding transcriptional regulator, GntR family [Rhodococcus kyotonensis]
MLERMTEDRRKRVTLQDKIYTRLLQEILSGELEPGSRLLVAHLAARFGTSQAPVREALRRLTEEGLADTTPYSGTVLKEPTWAEIEDLYLLREQLEAFAVRRMFEQRSVKLQSIKAALRDLQRAVRAGDPVWVIDADLEFHRSVCEAAGSALTLEMWNTIVKRQRGTRLTNERRQRDDFSTVVETHQELLDALETGDPNVAEQAFRDHLSKARRRVEEIRLASAREDSTASRENAGL